MKLLITYPKPLPMSHDPRAMMDAVTIFEIGQAGEFYFVCCFGWAKIAKGTMRAKEIRGVPSAVIAPGYYANILSRLDASENLANAIETLSRVFHVYRTAP